MTTFSLKDRYCKCGAQCVWVFSDIRPSRSIPYFARCPICLIIVNEYLEKEESTSTILTPDKAFECFVNTENLKKRVEELERIRCAHEKALREIAEADCDCIFMYGRRFCPSCIAKEALEAKNE